ncbi:MAG: cytochrome b [Burkholderiales bacterium]|nr:cytochrome b [Burkholderiales bacterium]MDE2398200.1 cytochrome b [Burkholderiales bacterium]MDE2452986.1 cytochrome b [Burkholderiales bacterium]
MIRTAPVPARYDRRSIALHWATALIVVALWVLGQCIDFFPKGTPRVGARSVHIVLGIALGLLILVRLRWRLGQGSKLPPAGAGALDKVALVVHKMLYLLLVATVLLGLLNAIKRGDNLFGIVSFPTFAPDDRALRETIENLHALSANLLLGLAGLHAVAALYHHLVLKDGVLARMMPAPGRR